MKKQQIKPSNLQVSIELVTPEIAAAWMALNIKNRLISKDGLREYKRSMEDNEWEETGETIKFDEDGNLVDGQHRLTAIIHTKKSHNMVIVRGLKKSAISVLDLGKRRSFADILGITGEVNCTKLATALNLFMFYKADKFVSFCGRRRFNSNPQSIAILSKNRQITESVKFIINMPNKTLFSLGYSAALHYIFSKNNPDEASIFFRKLYNGYGFNENDPILIVRNQLMNNQISNLKFDSFHAVMFIILAWNDFINDIRPSHKAYKFDRNKDTIPEILYSQPQLKLEVVK